MKRSTKAVLSLTVAAIIIGVTYAAILVQKNVPASMRVERAVAMDVFDVDGHTPLTSLAFGDFLWSQYFYYPGKVSSYPAEAYYCNNTNQMDFYLQVQAINVPDQVSIMMRFRRLDQPSWSAEMGIVEAPAIYQTPLISKVNDPNILLHSLQWQLFVAVNPGAPFGDFTPTLVFSAVSSPTG